MKKIDACKLRRKGGFTLVELIVVLVMLAVLSAVAVPTYLGFVDDNKARQCETHRKALASRLEEMSAMGSTASLTEEVLNSDENGCPAGGRYELDDSPEGSDINSMTITCDKHGSTTVMLKNNSQVTAKSNTETEKKGGEPETGKTEPPAPETPDPKEPKFEIKIDPASQTINLSDSAPKSLTAEVVAAEECNGTPDGYEWSASPAGIVSIDGNGKSINVTAVGQGSCSITCTAMTKRNDGTGTISDESTASIMVQGGGVLLPEEIFIPVWQMNNTESENMVNTHIFEELLNYGYNVPKGGLWECDDPRVKVENDEGYVKYNESTGLYEGDGGYIRIADNDMAGRYRLTYTYKGTTTGMWAQIVYPIYGLHSSDSQVFSMELEDDCQLTVSYEWPNTTDGPMEWSCKDDRIIEFSPVAGAEKNNKVTVKAMSVGTTTLTASMLCHYNQVTNKTPLYQTFTYTITVNYKTITGATAEKLVLVEGGEPQQIQFTPIPSTGTDPRVTYKYNGSKNQNDDVLTVTDDGFVTPKKACNAIVYFDAYLDGKVVCGGIPCEVEIKADTSKVEVQGKKINAASWENLQEYLAGGQTDESFNRGGVYVRTYYEQWGAEQKELLVINPNASFEWKEEYENMTFEEFLNEPGIREQLFIPVNSNCIDLLANNAYYWAGPGSIAKRGEDLYVCIKQVDKGNVSEWPNGYLEEYFVKIA